MSKPRKNPRRPAPSRARARGEQPFRPKPPMQKPPPPAYSADVGDRSRGEVLIAICARIVDGTPIAHAAALEGVPKRTLYDWMAADESGMTRASIDAARAAGAERYRAQLEQLIGRDRKAANVLLHLMSTLYPDEYAPAPKKLEHSGPNGGPQEHSLKVETMTNEQLLAKLPEALEALKRAGAKPAEPQPLQDGER